MIHGGERRDLVARVASLQTSVATAPPTYPEGRTMSTYIHPGDTVTVTIGQNVPATSELANLVDPFTTGQVAMKMHHWRQFRDDVVNAVGNLLLGPVFVYEGKGEWDGGTEDSVCVVALSDRHQNGDVLYAELADLASKYDQEAIGLAIGPGVLVPPHTKPRNLATEIRATWPGGEFTPHSVARRLRELGHPYDDETALKVHDVLIGRAS